MRTSHSKKDPVPEGIPVEKEEKGPPVKERFSNEMRRVRKLCLLGACAMVLIAFFLPWAKLDAKAMFVPLGQISTVRGYQIPDFVRNKKIALAVGLSEVFYGKYYVKELSLSVYAIPAFVIVGSLLVLGSTRWLSILIALFGFTIAAYGGYSIYTADWSAESWTVNYQFREGIWMSLAAYVLLGLGASANLFCRRK